MNDVKERILARRAALVAAALTQCEPTSKPVPTVPIAPGDADAASVTLAPEDAGPPPAPCLSPVAMPIDASEPAPCLSVAVIVDAGPAPVPCLSPMPCLKPTPPKPCLKIAP